MLDPWCHTASISVDRDAHAALAYLADGIRMGEWALGSVDREKVGEGLFVGRSMFDGSRQFIRIQADEAEQLVYYEVGPTGENLRRLAMARVVPGGLLGIGAGRAVVTLMTWRPQGMAEADWQRLCSSHETEMFIIKGKLEGAA